MSKIRKWVLFELLATVGCVGQQAYYSREAYASEGHSVLRVDSNLVLVPVTVTDSRGGLVTDLSRTDFMVAEDKHPQELVSFSRENAPISLGVVLDVSGSMTKKMTKARAAVGEFLNNLDPEDEEFLVTFSDAPEFASSFTSDTAVIHKALLSASPRGRTALFDAVVLAIREMRNARHQRRILLLISDGGDNHSRFSEGELRHLVEEEDLQIHAIGIHDQRPTMEESRGAQILKDLSAVTGGQHHTVNNIAELPALAKRMSLSLHDRYLLGYRPTPAGPSGTFRRIEVKVKQPKGASRVYVYARGGYRMP